ncbi:MarR family transcriptional regulator [Solwaraspora sp. WMMA2056]|uniref:MarR family winged helix-turn-helix transcriptional regulator n=1 Tax=Solwaraspora sp. WMMA2056 TaxID=3015161 RepID=UPI00259B0E74|nr:MarR family transcriptional regulator [Solwaraspora sp. WMMA2056]WJK39497.1 MarR family transcriptional regulator [Solwaraspora sp. WMMA2056]
MDHRDLVDAIRANHEIFMTTSDRLEPALTAHGLTNATAQALWAIDPTGPALSMKALAERLYCNAPNLSFIANQLIERGLVERSVDPTDRRGRVLALTDKGRQVRQEIIAATLEASPFTDCPPQLLHELATLLRQVAAGQPVRNR